MIKKIKDKLFSSNLAWDLSILDRDSKDTYGVNFFFLLLQECCLLVLNKKVCQVQSAFFHTVYILQKKPISIQYWFEI